MYKDLQSNDFYPKYILGIDPSFAHLGLSIIDRYNKKIMTYDIQMTLGKQSFWNVCEKSRMQVQSVIDTVDAVNLNILNSLDTVIGMEHALPYGYCAAPLTALDILLYYRLGILKTALFSPTYLNFLMGKHTKRDSINLALGLLKIFGEFGYDHCTQSESKLTDGEAESFIYACRIFCRTKPEDTLTLKILEMFPGFSEEHEIYDKEFVH